MTALHSRWLIPLSLLGALAGCQGHGGDTGQTTGPQNCTALDPVPRRIWRLSVQQYSNSVRDVLGLQTGPTIATTGGTSEYAFFSPDSAAVDGDLAFQLNLTIRQVMTANAAMIPSLAACQAGEAEMACATRFAQTFGQRAFRRPLDSGEVTNLLVVYTEGRKQDFNTGISLMIQALLQAPSFLFRTELGTGTADPVTLTPYEVASQLSYMFLDSVPDQGLRDAAASGRLSTEAGIAAEVDRLLGTDAVKFNIDRIVLDWFNTRQLYAKTKDPSLLTATGGVTQDQTALQNDLYASAYNFVDNQLWFSGGKVTDLLTSQTLYLTQRLATLYGVPFNAASANSGWIAVDAPDGQRAGLLTQPAVLWAASDAALTSIVKRGIFIHNDVVCAEPLPPPIGILDDPAVQAKLAMLPTEIDKSNYRMMTGQCVACHGNIDPYGRVLEGFDPIGRAIPDKDQAGNPVDPTGDFSNAYPLTGSITGAQNFAHAIIGDKQFTQCSAQMMTSYALGRAIHTFATCEIQQVRENFENKGGTITELFRQVATAKFMRTRTGGAQ
jgi:hypothetical protein